MELIKKYLRSSEHNVRSALFFLVYDNTNNKYIYTFCCYYLSFWSIYVNLLKKHNININETPFCIEILNEKDKDLSLYMLQGLIRAFKLDIIYKIKGD